MTRSLITGVAGQDGRYLAELLLGEGHEVHGVVRPGSGAVVAGATMHEADLSTEAAASDLVDSIGPDQVFNLAAVSSVFRSWQEPALTARVNGTFVADLLAACLALQGRSGRSVIVVQASSAEIFGMPDTSPQDEDTPVRPTSPYGAAKAYAHGLVGVYRGAGLAASSCILYNHESPLRPQSFVTRKITAAAARISLGLQDRLELGNLHARRDWGWAPDYADAMLRAAAAPDPDDYVIATGESHSIEDFVAAAFTRVGIVDWRPLVELSASLTRVGDAPELVGDASKARRALGWAPTRRFDDIVAAMVDDDLRIASGG